MSTAPGSGRLAAGWSVVMGQELRDLWLASRGPALVLAFALLLSALTYLAATNKELNLLDQRDTVNLVLQITLGLGVILGLLFSADSISGERERETFETLLLTPLRPREVVVGKLLAALTVWPVIMLVAVPYVYALRVGGELSIESIAAASMVGSILTVAFASFGMALSTFSDSNRLSLGLSLFVFVVLMAPTQLPLSGWLGDLMVSVNPVSAGSRFLDRIIVNGHSWGDEATYLIAPIAAMIAGVVVMLLAAGRLRLEGGVGR